MAILFILSMQKGQKRTNARSWLQCERCMYATQHEGWIRELLQNPGQAVQQKIIVISLPNLSKKSLENQGTMLETAGSRQT